MLCSWFERRLAGFVDGSLAANERGAVAEHIEGCPKCAPLLEELRVVDALLVTATTLDPAPNFTFRVMAEARSMPPPYVRRTPFGPVLATYLAFAWVAIALWVTLFGKSAIASFAVLSDALAGIVNSADRLARTLGHLFGGSIFSVTAAVSSVLVLDFFFAVGIAAAFIAMQPRLRGGARS